MSTVANTAHLDRAAVGISALCLIHCLALPVFAAALPVLATVAEAEWLHKAFVLFAVPISVMAILKTRGSKFALLFSGLAVTGLAFLMAGAFIEALHDFETPLTVAGAVILSLAHVLRWRRHAPSTP